MLYTMIFQRIYNQYVHRSGRTGRFGASGTVISLVTEREERELKKYARELGVSSRSQKDFMEKTSLIWSSLIISVPI